RLSASRPRTPPVRRPAPRAPGALRPRQRLGWLAPAPFEQRRPLPRVLARPGWNGGGRRLPHEPFERRDDRDGLLGRRAGSDELELRAAVHCAASGYRGRAVAVPVLDRDAVLAAVSPAEAIERVADAFVRFDAGEWTMPPKIYLDSPPHGDFRAMPARGGGLALLKWVTSSPGTPARGLPTVTGVICLSDADDGEPLMLLD